MIVRSCDGRPGTLAFDTLVLSTAHEQQPLAIQ
jgi:hypothetical protein